MFRTLQAGQLGNKQQSEQPKAPVERTVIIDEFTSFLDRATAEGVHEHRALDAETSFG